MAKNIQNYGYTNIMIDKNNKKNNLSMEWVGNYDGNVADLKVKLNSDGNEKVMDLQLDNEDIINLLNIPSHRHSLDERLLNDFSNQEMLYISELPIINLSSHKKRRKSRKIKKLKSRTKKLYTLF